MGFVKGIVMLLALSIARFDTAQASAAIAANCQPWKVPVAVDPPNHNHRPFYVEMHRCMGQCNTNPVISPRQCECVAETTQPITLNVITTAGYKAIVFENHTSCRSQCKASYKERCVNNGHNWNEPTCTCGCPRPSGGTCPPNKVWDTSSCQCQCASSASPCRPGMSWNESSCGCQCDAQVFVRCSQNGRTTDLHKCTCGRRTSQPVVGKTGKSEDSESKTKLVVPLVAIGLLLGTLFIIDLVLMCSKKGFMYGLMTKCSEGKGDAGLRLNEKESTDTGSISLNIETSQRGGKEECTHKNGRTTKTPVSHV